MATYILFWNPDISSYTKERFLDDFDYHEDVGNWSFHEHEKVKYGDTFFMVKCGAGKTGIVMRGMITSGSYHDEDWSPKKRKEIYYADIEAGVTVNPWSDAPILSPEKLTEAIPDFNWFGGHSGRLLGVKDANKLEKLWLEYLDGNQKMFCDDDAWIKEYNRTAISSAEAKKIIKRAGGRCEICGYSYAKIFGEEVAKYDLDKYPSPIMNPSLHRLFFNICSNCCRMPEELLSRKLLEKQGD